MKSIKFRGRHAAVLAAAARPLVDRLENRTLLAYTAISGINDVVYDGSRNVVYATTGGGQIQRYDVASGTLLTPWTIGGNLLGADITPDNAFLYVADGSNPQIRKVNLANGTSVALTYTPAFGESNAYDVAVVGTRAIFTTQFSGSGWTPLRNIDIATDAMTTRSDLSSVRQNSVLSRAADYSGLFLTEANISSGPIHYYTTASDTFTNSASTETFLGGVLHDVSRDGKLVALGLSGTSLYDNSLNGLQTLSALSGGMRFDPGRDLLYGINPTTDQLIGYDTAAKLQRFSIPLGRNLAGGSVYASGEMAIGSSKAFISDDAGLLVLDLPQPTGQAATLQISGHYSFSRKGVQGTVRIQALDPAGYPATQYRGTIHLSSSDLAANLPPNYTFTAADNGYVELPVTLNTVGTQSITVQDVSNGALLGQLTGRQVHAGNVSLIPVTDRREHVFDPLRDRLYISTTRGVIERYDLATETLLEPLPVGTSLNGIDISSDSRWLVAQEATSTGAGGQYLKVDLNAIDSGGLNSNYLTTILYANYSLESGGYDIARTSRGTFAADGMFAGSGWVPVRDINPITNAAPNMPTFNSVRQNTGIGRSPDGRYLVYTESNISSGPITVFDTQTNTVVSSIGTSTFLSGESSAVNRDGTIFGVHLSGTRMYNRSLAVITTLSTIDGGTAFDPVADVFYGVESSSDKLIVYRTSDWAVLNSVAIGENVSGSSAMGSGVMTVAVDGGLIFLSTPAGIRVVTLDTRALAGSYTVAEGGSLTLQGSGVAAPGRTLTKYEWDFNYDGTNFTSDAVGQNVNMPTTGFDGPSTRQIALRVTDSSNVTNVAAGTVNIVNTAPTIGVSAPATVGVGGTLTLNLSATDPGPDTITSWTINWGEGSPQTIAGGSSISPSRVLNVEGAHTITISATDEDGTYSATPVQVLVSTPPTIQSVVYDYAAATPAVKVTFSEDVGASIQRGDFEIIQLASGLAIPLSKTTAVYDAGTFTATLRFPGFAGGVIPDGNYQITAFADGIRDGINNALDGNGDGVAGDDAVASFFVLAGDADGDRHVDQTDRNLMMATMGKSGSFAQGDFNYSGFVDAADQTILDAQWHEWLPTPGPVALPGSGGDDVYRIRLAYPTMLHVYAGADPLPLWRIPASGITALSFDGAGGNDSLTLDFADGNPIPAGGITFTGGAGNDTFAFIGTPLAEAVAYNPTNVTLGGGAGGVVNRSGVEAFLFDGRGGGDSLSVNSGVVALTATQSLASLTVAPGAALDVRDHGLALNYSAASPVGSWNGSAYTGIIGQIASGRAGGQWNGAGIITTMPDARLPNTLTSVAVAEASETLGIAGAQTAMWDGQVVDATTVLVKYTYTGDANLDGEITGDDYFLIDSAFPSGGHGWSHGDFNYDGTNSGDDYFLIDSTYAAQGSPL